MGKELAKEAIASLLVLSLTGSSLSHPVFAQPSDVMRQAIDLYSQGRLEEAAQLMQKDLRDHPDSGVAHEYMGKILEKQGLDKQALQEFETAFRLIPQGVVDAGIKTAVSEVTGKPGASTQSTKPAGSWFETIWNNTVDGATRLFGGTPAPRPTSTSAPSYQIPFNLTTDPTAAMPFCE